MNRYKAPQHMIPPLLIILLALLAATCNFQRAVLDTPLPPDLPGPTDTSIPVPTPKPGNTSTPAPTPMPSDLIWFGPNMGSRDYPELFTKPEQWSAVRSRIDVFKFHTQNVLAYPCAICGDNTLNTFGDVQGFQRLTEWGIAIGVDVGAVKEWGCTGSEEFRVAKETIQNIRANGGKVTFLVMDEPFLGGEWAPSGSKACGHTMEQSADVTAKFVKQVTVAYPNIIVGDTEPYPYFLVAELEQWIEALEERGATPAFFHLDVDMVRVRTEKQDVVSDLQALSQFFEEHRIPFGVIFTSNTNWNAHSNRAYFDSTMEWIHIVNDSIGRPQHVIFNSWLGPAPTGAHELPINLPEDDPSEYSHTRLIIEGLDVFGQ